MEPWALEGQGLCGRALPGGPGGCGGGQEGLGADGAGNHGAALSWDPHPRVSGIPPYHRRCPEEGAQGWGLGKPLRGPGQGALVVTPQVWF